MRSGSYIICGSKALWATTPKAGVEEITLKLIVAKFFIPDTEHCIWLVFDKKTGQGAGVIFGCMRPKQKGLKRHKLPFGIAEVDPKFHPLVLAHGPEALRWNGQAVVT
jgi:hypothetical protein